MGFGANLGQAVGNVINTAASTAASSVGSAVTPGQSNNNQTVVPVDIKQAALELVMPKLDAQTLAKYVGKFAENVEEDLRQKEEQERLAKEEEQRKQNLGLAPKPESVLDKKDEDKKDGYSVTEYMKLADALRQSGRPVNNEEILNAQLEAEKRRLG